MIKNYFKIAWRNLLKHKAFSLINIVGLAIGIAACVIIFFYVHHELTFDQYNTKSERIVRVSTIMHAPESDLVLATSPAPLGDALKREYPEVAAVVRIEPANKAVKFNNDVFREEAFFSADQDIFSVFDFDFIEGSPANSLDQPNTIVITSSIAKKYFGINPAVGKVMTCDGKDLLVKGVVKDRPANSDIKIDALLSIDYSKVPSWMDDFPLYTFVLFKTKPELKTFEHKLEALSAKHVQPELNKMGATQYKVQFATELLADVHFSKGKLADMPKGNKQYNYVFSILAVFILLIALLNYINLSTAKATERAKEVGIRKVSGALPFQLIKQFLFESSLLIAIAWVLSLVLLWVSIPFINKLLQTTLTINWTNAILFTSVIFILTIVLAGLYPAFVLSSFKPVKVLKGNWRNSGRGLLLRKGVTITQFVIAAALIMGTTVIYNQLHYIEKKDLGFNKEQLLNIFLPRDSVYLSSVNAFQNALRSRPEVKNMTIGGGMTDGGLTMSTTFAESPEGKKRELMCYYYPVDSHFLPVFQIKLAEGRNLSDSFGTDKKEAFIVNEAFVRMMGWKSGVGKSIEGWEHKGKIVGVVKDFYYKSLHNLVEPLILVYNLFPANTTTIKVKPADLPVIKDIFKTHFPSLPMDYSFYDEIVGEQYKQDKITMSLFNDFTILAIFISCLGLYGLVSLIAVQRSKEISIRKVLGASLTQLLATLSKGFIKLICVALIIALPVAGFFMNKWLNSYAYHTPLALWMFFVPVLVVLFIALAVISTEVIKTAMANPVKSLRTE